jgi:hypothetical protein
MVRLLATIDAMKRSAYLKVGLIRLHREIGLLAREKWKEVRKLRHQMVLIEQVLKIVDPTFDGHTIAPLRRRWTRNSNFPRGRLFPRALAVMREAKRPLLVTEIASAMFRAHNVPTPTKKQAQYLAMSLHGALKYHARRGLTAHDGGHPRRWQLTNN